MVAAIFIAKVSQEECFFGNYFHFVRKVSQEECFYGNYFHFVRQAPNYVFPLQVFVLSFVAAIEQ